MEWEKATGYGRYCSYDQNLYLARPLVIYISKWQLIRTSLPPQACATSLTFRQMPESSLTCTPDCLPAKASALRKRTADLTSTDSRTVLFNQPRAVLESVVWTETILASATEKKGKVWCFRCWSDEKEPQDCRNMVIACDGSRRQKDQGRMATASNEYHRETHVQSDQTKEERKLCWALLVYWIMWRKERRENEYGTRKTREWKKDCSNFSAI